MDVIADDIFLSYFYVYYFHMHGVIIAQNGSSWLMVRIQWMLAASYLALSFISLRRVNQDDYIERIDTPPGKRKNGTGMGTYMN